MKRNIRRVSLGVSEALEYSLGDLKGAPVVALFRNNSEAETVGRFNAPHATTITDYTIEPETEARALGRFLEEAVFALEEFKAKHGYIPRQPRFEVIANGDRPAPPRSLERWGEVHALEKFLGKDESA